MNKELTCNQVSALINFYIEGKLNPRLKEYVDIHLSKCPACRRKIEELQKILNKYKTTTTNSEQKEKSYNPELISKLSAYVDNELNSNENIKIKKMTISNPTARKELETLYKYKRALQSAYTKTKNDSRFDYSKDIIAQIQDTETYTTNYFYKLSAVFVLLIIAIIASFIYLYF